MNQIVKLTIFTNQGTLAILDSAKNTAELTFEYLRVFSPQERQKANPQKSEAKTPQVFHKKQVKLLNIEPVGKHGYRFIFDDEFSDIYSNEDLTNLTLHFNEWWAAYTNSLSSINSREESINFKAVT